MVTTLVKTALCRIVRGLGVSIQQYRFNGVSRVLNKEGQKERMMTNLFYFPGDVSVCLFCLAAFVQYAFLPNAFLLNAYFP